MNLNIMLMEIKRLKKTLLIALIAPAAYAALIMVFFIAFSDVIGEMTYLFDNASLQGLLKAFSMDSNTFSYILNFYVSYNGIYVLIMGIIFASILNVNLFSKELRSGTYEFLYGNPVSRPTVFLSKMMVMVSYLFVMNLVVFLVGFGSIETLKSKSPLIPWLSEENESILILKADENPEVLLSTFVLDDALFYEVIYSNVTTQFEQMSEVASLEVDSDIMTNLLGVFILNPDGVYDELLKNKEKYSVAFGIIDLSQYTKFIEMQKKTYFDMKNNFSSDSSLVLKLFKENMRPFMDQLVDLDQTTLLKENLNLEEHVYEDLFVHYSLKNFVKFTIACFLIMLTISLFTLALTVVVPKGRFSTGMAMGVCMLFYMVNIIGNITEQASFLKYVTPLSYLNMDVMLIKYQTDTWSLITLGVVSILSITSALLYFSKSDFIS